MEYESKIIQTGPYDVQNKWKKRGENVQIIVLQLNKDKSYDLSRYNYLMNFYKNFIEQDVLRYVSISYNENYTKTLEKTYNLSNCYFEEEYKIEINKYQNKINEYQRNLEKKFN